jgi:hypothetical protein
MATPLSDVSICNSALIKVGAERINTLDDDSKPAKLCKEQYCKVRDGLLRGHPWNFAIGRQSLALSATYTPAFEFESAFPYPANVLKIVKLDINLGTQLTERQWKVEIDPSDYKKYIVCNSDALAIEAIYSVPESRFAYDFAEALAYQLAADIAYALTNSTTLSNQLTIKANAALAMARSMDAQEASVPKAQDGQYLYARLSGGPGFRND